MVEIIKGIIVMILLTAFFCVFCLLILIFIREILETYDDLKSRFTKKDDGSYGYEKYSKGAIQWLQLKRRLQNLK